MRTIRQLTYVTSDGNHHADLHRASVCEAIIILGMHQNEKSKHDAVLNLSDQYRKNLMEFNGVHNTSDEGENVISLIYDYENGILILESLIEACKVIFKTWAKK